MSRLLLNAIEHLVTKKNQILKLYYYFFFFYMILQVKDHFGQIYFRPSKYKN